MINPAKKNFVLINAILFICYVLLASHIRNKKKAEEEELIITGLPSEEEVVDAEIAEVESAILSDIEARTKAKKWKQGKKRRRNQC